MRNRALSSLAAIKLILVNHSPRISKETKAWFATWPENRFTFFFIPLLHPETRLLAQFG